MKSILFIFALLFLVVLGIGFVRGGYHFSLFSRAQNMATVKIKNVTLTVPVAKDEKTKEIGLSGKPSIPQDSGMLFVFDRADYQPFWMRNMEFPIDMIFLNKNKVVTIFKNVKAPAPKTLVQNLTIYKPSHPADVVLEVNAGLSDKYALKEGDTLQIAL